MNRTRTLEAGILSAGVREGTALLVAAILLCTACNKQEDPDETARDVSAAAAEGREEVADATHAANESTTDAAHDIRDANDASDRNEAVADAQESAGKSAREVAMEKAEADRDIGKQKCDGLPADQQSACNDTVDAAYDKAKIAAERVEDAADERATVMRDKP